MLTAGSDRQDRLGRLDDLRAALAGRRGGWFAWLVASRRAAVPAAAGGTGGARSRCSSRVPLVDALLAPDATFVAPALVALWLGATAPTRRSERAAAPGRRRLPRGA